MLLSKEERNDYLHNVVLKNFHFWQAQSNGVILFDTNNTIIAANTAAQQDFGTIDIIGLNSSSLFRRTNQDILKNSNICSTAYTKDLDDACDCLLKIDQIVITNKIQLNYACFMPHNNEFRSLMLQATPILHENGEVVGVWHFASEFNFFGIEDHFNVLQNKPAVPIRIARTEHKFPINLTTRQHEVLFLLVRGVSQRNAAHMLNISRGNVSKIISEYICPKFGINDADSELLIDKAINMDYDKYIPQSLCKINVRILDQNIQEKYFLSPCIGDSVHA